MKEIVADVYLPERCDDIGVVVSVEYVCPYCGKAEKRTTLEDLSPSHYDFIVDRCSRCGESVTVKAK